MADTAKVRRTARVPGNPETEIRCDGLKFEDATKAIFEHVKRTKLPHLEMMTVEVRDPDDGAGWRQFRVRAVTHLEVDGLRGGE